MRPAR